MPIERTTGPTIASPNSMASHSPLVVGSVRVALSRDSHPLLSQGFHTQAVWAAPPAVPAEQEAYQDQADERGCFSEGKSIWISLPVFNPRVFVKVRISMSRIATSCCVERVIA